MQQGYKFVKTRTVHVCEHCGERIPKNTLVVTDVLVDLSKSMTGALYTGYFIIGHYRKTLHGQEVDVFNKLLKTICIGTQVPMR